MVALLHSGKKLQKCVFKVECMYVFRCFLLMRIPICAYVYIRLADKKRGECRKRWSADTKRLHIKLIGSYVRIPLSRISEETDSGNQFSLMADECGRFKSIWQLSSTLL